MSTNCLQYLFYCIVISMKPNLLLLLDLYVGSGRATFFNLLCIVYNSFRNKKFIVKDIFGGTVHSDYE